MENSDIILGFLQSVLEERFLRCSVAQNLYDKIFTVSVFTKRFYKRNLWNLVVYKEILCNNKKGSIYAYTVPGVENEHKGRKGDPPHRTLPPRILHYNAPAKN